MIDASPFPNDAALSRERELAIVLRQYKPLAAAINDLFNALSQKAPSEDWRQDGIGTCAVGPFSFDNHLEGVADLSFPALWDDIANKVRAGGKVLGGFADASGIHAACPFHAKKEGCILGDLKPARCLSHVEQSNSEIEPLLGIDGTELQTFLYDALSARKIRKRQATFSQKI